uniref:Ig-like domain-containing protein n=1 Tax=Scleropages formosus TaxID=113540 RepID=A0A8C9VQZ5_SCLFO
MQLIWLLLLLQGSAQLECDRTHLQGIVGGSLMVMCKYNTHRFILSKKYWCHGDSRSTCEILADTEGFTKANVRDHFQIRDLRQKGLFVLMANLRLDDSGVYWIGIDKIYADIMSRIQVRVSEEILTKPRVWFPSPPQSSCWGQPVTVLCSSDRGTRVRYAWYQTGRTQDVKIADQDSLHLHCAAMEEDGRYYCVASNSLGSERSRTVTAQLLQPAEEDCIYAVTVNNESSYNCRERLGTTTTALSETTQEENEICFGSSAMSIDHATGLQNSRTMSTLPLWYKVLRWLLLSALLLILALVRRRSRTAPRPVLRRTSYPTACRHRVTFTKTMHEVKL